MWIGRLRINHESNDGTPHNRHADLNAVYLAIPSSDVIYCRNPQRGGTETRGLVSWTHKWSLSAKGDVIEEAIACMSEPGLHAIGDNMFGDEGALSIRQQ